MSTLTDDRRLPSSIEWWVSVFTLVLYTGAVFGLLDARHLETGRGTSGAAILRVLLLFVYAFAMYVTIRDRAYIPRGSRRDPWVTLIVALTLVSSLWSSLPGQTLVRASELLLTTWFAAYLARWYSREEQLRMLAQSLLVVLLMSLLAGALFPGAGIMHGGEFEGAWRGVFIHKNYLGRIAFLGCIVYGMAIATGQPWRALSRLGLATTLLCLALSTSRTAWVSTALLVCTVPLLRALKRRGPALIVYAVIISAILTGAGVWLNTHVDYVMDLLGRNITLTGRTAVWFAVMTFIARRPMLGYGYTAFWQGMTGDSGFISLALKWEVPHAHNGILELGLDVGMIGVALFAISFAVACRQALRVYRSQDSGISLWPLLGIVFVVLANVAESSLVRYNNVFWVLYVMIVLSTQPVRPPVDAAR